ncbi:MAG: gluconate 2-dehydrogenase subunit 3 family protein, partial [Bryobacteraceae bacterium]
TMTRRDTFRAAALAAASGPQLIFLQKISAAESHHEHSAAPPEPDRWSNYKPQFFSTEEFETLEGYTEILIPTDDQPGAREAHAAHYIDFTVHAAAANAPEMQTEWRSAMAWLREHKFHDATAGERLAMVERMAAPEHDAAAARDGFPVYKLIKGMAVFAFYTSREGLIGNLGYKGLAYLTEVPACNHPEHHTV